MPAGGRAKPGHVRATTRTDWGSQRGSVGQSGRAFSQLGGRRHWPAGQAYERPGSKWNVTARSATGALRSALSRASRRSSRAHSAARDPNRRAIAQVPSSCIRHRDGDLRLTNKGQVNRGSVG